MEIKYQNQYPLLQLYIVRAKKFSTQPRKEKLIKRICVEFFEEVF